MYVFVEKCSSVFLPNTIIIMLLQKTSNFLKMLFYLSINNGPDILTNYLVRNQGIPCTVRPELQNSLQDSTQYTQMDKILKSSFHWSYRELNLGTSSFSANSASRWATEVVVDKYAILFSLYIKVIHHMLSQVMNNDDVVINFEHVIYTIITWSNEQHQNTHVDAHRDHPDEIIHFFFIVSLRLIHEWYLFNVCLFT